MKTKNFFQKQCRRIFLFLAVFATNIAISQDEFSIDSLMIKKVFDETLLSGESTANLEYLTSKIGARISGSKNAQKTVVPFSNYLVDSNLVFLSGQIGVKSADDPQENFKIEVKEIIENVSKYLKNAGSSLNKVISVTVYLKDMGHFAEFNEIYKEYFQAPFPERTCIGVQDLVMNANIEMTVIARLK